VLKPVNKTLIDELITFVAIFGLLSMRTCTNTLMSYFLLISVIIGNDGSTITDYTVQFCRIYLCEVLLYIWTFQHLIIR